MAAAMKQLRKLATNSRIPFGDTKSFRNFCQQKPPTESRSAIPPKQSVKLQEKSVTAGLEKYDNLIDEYCLQARQGLRGIDERQKLIMKYKTRSYIGVTFAACATLFAIAGVGHRILDEKFEERKKKMQKKKME